MKSLAILSVLIGMAFAAAAQPSITNDAKPSAQPTMFQKCYQLDTKALSKMRSFLGAKETDSEAEVLFSYLKQKRMELSPPSCLYYSHGRKDLLYRSTNENLDKLEKIFAELKSEK